MCTLCRIFSHTLFINRISKVYQARPEYTMDVIRIRNSQTYVGEKLTDAREKLTRRRKVGLWLIVYEFQIISASRSQRQISRETFDRSGYFGLYICIFLLLVGREEDHRWKKESRRNAKKFGKIYRKIREKKRRKGEIERIFHGNAIIEYILQNELFSKNCGNFNHMIEF